MTKLLLESEFQHKGNKQMKKCEFSAKSCSFFAATDSENKNYSNTTQTRTNKVFD